MKLLASSDTIKLLRFPFSLFLLPVFLLCLSQATVIDPVSATWTFVIIHFLVYPASNGYNSYIDKDTTSIGGLANPPLPTRSLFYITLVMDAAALLLAALLVNLLFAACIFLYIMASRAYSAPQVRFKKYPYAGFLIVTFFQGAFTYYMCYLGITGMPLAFTPPAFFILLACSFQIAGAYPLTQIYQHRADLEDGVVTLSYKLGYRGTFLFSGLMFIACNLLFYLYFGSLEKGTHFIFLQLFFIPLVLYFLWWLKKVYNNNDEANYKNTMRMNLVASLCMGLCFVFFILLKYFQ
jgi:4-hydroxybenzoate polyprenyltransferase